MLELHEIDNEKLVEELELEIKRIYTDLAHAMITVDKLRKAFDVRREHFKKLEEEYADATFHIVRGGE